MALLGINPVTAPSQPEKEKGLSDFEKLVQGLQAANSAFGIYTDLTKIEQNRALAEKGQAELFETRALQGGQSTLANLQGQGFVPVPSGLEPRFGEGAIDPATGFPRSGEKFPVGVSMDVTTREGRGEVTRPQQMIPKDLLEKLSAMTPAQQADFLSGELEKQKKMSVLDEKIGKDISDFRQTDLYKKNLSGVLAGQYVFNALKEGSGPGDFIAAVETIRGVAGDVGPMKESELGYIKGRLGILEKGEGLIDKWFRNQSMTDDERATLAKAVKAAADSRRKNLSTLEQTKARDIASTYREINYEDVFPKIDSRETFRVGDLNLENFRRRPPGGQKAVPNAMPVEKEKSTLIDRYDQLQSIIKEQMGL